MTTTHSARYNETTQMIHNAQPTKQNQCFAFESRQADHFFIRDEIQLVKDGVVFGQILVLVQLLLATEPRAVHCTAQLAAHDT